MGYANITTNFIVNIDEIDFVANTVYPPKIIGIYILEFFEKISWLSNTFIYIKLPKIATKDKSTKHVLCPIRSDKYIKKVTNIAVIIK